MTTIDGMLRPSLETALRLSLGVLFLSILLTGVFGWQLPAFIPMLFSRPFGDRQLVPFWVFFFYPLFQLFFYGLSFWVFRKCTASLVTAALSLWMSALASSLLLLSQIYVLFLIF